MTDIVQGTHWSLTVLDFKCCKFKALKVLEHEGGPSESLKSCVICSAGFGKFCGGMDGY